jgi:hypothetical protein
MPNVRDILVLSTFECLRHFLILLESRLTSFFHRLVGVGEASFISLAAPFIDDNAPVAQV